MVRYDEGDAYLHYVRHFAKMLDVPVKFVTIGSATAVYPRAWNRPQTIYAG